MLLEERDYGVRPGTAPRYLQAWEDLGRRPQEHHLGRTHGVYVVEVGELNTVVFHWCFPSFEDRQARRAALLADEDFAAFRARVRDLLVSQRTRLLVRTDHPAPEEPR
ncbi:NIPSNAP family protein [Amycolatopsis sp. NPDC004625]|uniref:NIPSNAP family protein n=1 Tax=Amycolatopsis sp. NPDC004625 TaxID=3154670 RepID=UPI0033BEC9E6